MTTQSQAPTRAQFHADFSRFMWVSPDSYGNPRVCIHFTEFLRANEQVNTVGDIEAAYSTARRRANSIGFRAYRGRDFGGGFTKQCYSLPRAIDKIYNMLYPSAK